MRPSELFSILRPPLSNSEMVKSGDNPWFQQPIVLELAFWIAVLILTALLLARFSFFEKAFENVESFGRSLSRKRSLVIIGVILSALALRAMLLLSMPYPEPLVHDEYSYLLQAQTFASGRLTNPTPAGWEHFETFHVNMRPTYQSMYPPGQVLFMAAAEVLHVHPWWGVWFSVGIMCGALCWMLQGWLPPQWALLGALFCVIRFSTFSDWINMYLGGSVAAIGGALVLGSLPRLKRNPNVRYSLLLALGLAILANTRPYEGLIFSLPTLLVLAVWFFPRWNRHEVQIAAFVPAVAFLLIVVLAMGYYNWRGTGNPLFMPYMANHQQYHITRPFIWQARQPIPDYRHAVMRSLYVIHELPDYLNRSVEGGFAQMLRKQIAVYYEFFVWPAFILGVFALWAMMKSRKMRVVAVTFFVMLLGLLMEQWPAQAQYAAPILGAILLIVIYGLRLAWTLRPKQIPVGPMLVRSFVLGVLVIGLLAAGKAALNPFHVSDEDQSVAREIERASLVSRLSTIPGDHLVFVHFHPWDRGEIFWIYNDPDLSKSRIIWAYDMGDAENRELMKLYPNRHDWLIDKDGGLDLLLPYPGLPGVGGPSQKLALKSIGEKYTQQ